MPGKKILIADDSATIRTELHNTLKEGGFEVTETTDGIEALKAIKLETFDLLLLDLEMPKMNGFELLRILKTDGPTYKLPILCITGVHTQLEEVHKLMEFGAKGYIRKGCSPEDLLFRVKQVIESPSR